MFHLEVMVVELLLRRDLLLLGLVRCLLSLLLLLAPLLVFLLLLVALLSRPNRPLGDELEPLRLPEGEVPGVLLLGGRSLVHVPGQGQQPDGARGVGYAEVMTPDVAPHTLGRVSVVASDAGDGVALTMVHSNESIQLYLCGVPEVFCF